MRTIGTSWIGKVASPEQKWLMTNFKVVYLVCTTVRAPGIVKSHQGWYQRRAENISLAGCKFLDHPGSPVLCDDGSRPPYCMTSCHTSATCNSYSASYRVV